MYISKWTSTSTCQIPVVVKMEILKDFIKVTLIEHLACMKQFPGQIYQTLSLVISRSDDDSSHDSNSSGDDGSSSSGDDDSSSEDISSSNESEPDKNQNQFTDLRANPPDWTTNFVPIDVPGFRLPSGPNLPNDWDIRSTPLKYFELFFTPELIDQFVKYSNEYAQIAIRKKGVKL